MEENYEIKFFFLQASDTISVTLDFTVFMLANFPEIQVRICIYFKKIEFIN